MSKIPGQLRDYADRTDREAARRGGAGLPRGDMPEQAALMRAAADEIERLTREHAEFAELVSEYAQAERPEAMEILAADRDKWWNAAEKAEAEVARLRETPLGALDAEMPPTVPQVQTLADAMWQVLDDMGTEGHSVCPATKARARVAYEPFRFTDDNGDDGLDMPLSEAEAILAEVEASSASSPIVKTEA